MNCLVFEQNQKYQCEYFSFNIDRATDTEAGTEVCVCVCVCVCALAYFLSLSTERTENKDIPAAMSTPSAKHWFLTIIFH